LSEQEYNGLLETLYLSSIPGMKEQLENVEIPLSLIQENPFHNQPPYEMLIGDLKGLYSRRINRQYRLVYRVLEAEKVIIVVSM